MAGGGATRSQAVLKGGRIPMALAQIQILPDGRTIWAKLSQAAKLVAQGRASYVVTVAEAEPDATPQAAAVAPPENAGRQPPRRGRR